MTKTTQVVLVIVTSWILTSSFWLYSISTGGKKYDSWRNYTAVTPSLSVKFQVATQKLMPNITRQGTLRHPELHNSLIYIGFG